MSHWVAVCSGAIYRDHNPGWFRREIVTYAGRMRGGWSYGGEQEQTKYSRISCLTCLEGQVWMSHCAVVVP